MPNFKPSLRTIRFYIFIEFQNNFYRCDFLYSGLNSKLGYFKALKLLWKQKTMHWKHFHAARIPDCSKIVQDDPQKSGNSRVWNQICMKIDIYKTSSRPIKVMSIKIKFFWWQTKTLIFQQFFIHFSSEPLQTQHEIPLLYPMRHEKIKS